MKKLISLFMVAICLFVLVSCGTGNNAASLPTPSAENKKGTAPIQLITHTHKVASIHQVLLQKKVFTNYITPHRPKIGAIYYTLTLKPRHVFIYVTGQIVRMTMILAQAICADIKDVGIFVQMKI